MHCKCVTYMFHFANAVSKPHLTAPKTGSDQAPMAERARDVWVDGLIAQLTGLPQQLWQHKCAHLRRSATG